VVSKEHPPVTRADRLANWLSWTYRGQITLWCMERFAFMVGMFFALAVLYFVEVKFFPVITQWELEYITRDKNTYTMGGVMRKDRACELLHTSVMAVPKVPMAPRVLIYQFQANEIIGAGGPVGRFTWGPWSVKVPDKLMGKLDWMEAIEVVGHHRCHMLWTQETVYGRVPVERLPQ
jgi:hypothetical protein